MSPGRLSRAVSGFHQDEDGIEALQVVMIVAIAAVVLIGFMTVGQEIFSWMREKWNSLRGQGIE